MVGLCFIFTTSPLKTLKQINENLLKLVWALSILAYLNTSVFAKANLNATFQLLSLKFYIIYENKM